MELTEKQEHFLELLPKLNMHVTNCCKQIGIDRSTYYRWCNKIDLFKQKRDDAREELYDMVESKIYEQIKEGNTTMIIFFAKTRMKQRGYIETVQKDNISTEPMVINFDVAEPVRELKITQGKG